MICIIINNYPHSQITISVLFLIYRGRRVSRRSVLLTGLCNSGKTVLYAKLVHGQSIKTFTSVKENSGDYAVNGVCILVQDNSPLLIM